MAGYSATPLVRKLGIREGTTVATIGAPATFPALLGDLPDGATLGDDLVADMVVVFARERADMVEGFGDAMTRIPADGAIWVAWPKRSSGVPTDLTEDVMRELFLPTGMVDTKVCAIDETWSGLRFVVRTEHRAGWRM